MSDVMFHNFTVPSADADAHSAYEDKPYDEREKGLEGAKATEETARLCSP